MADFSASFKRVRNVMACPDLEEAGTLAEFASKGNRRRRVNRLMQKGFQNDHGLDATALLAYDMADSADSLSLSRPAAGSHPERDFCCARATDLAIASATALPGSVTGSAPTRTGLPKDPPPMAKTDSAPPMARTGTTGAKSSSLSISSPPP